jgi:hypothetical protein
MGRNISVVDSPYFVQGGNNLPPVTGLDCVEPQSPVRDIFHIAASNLVSGHFFEAERDAGNPQPIRRIRTKRHSAGSAYDGKCTITHDAIHHANNTVLLRNYPHVRLGCWYPVGFIT